LGIASAFLQLIADTLVPDLMGWPFPSIGYRILDKSLSMGALPGIVNR
jgi:hypothetical protein